MLDNPMFLIVSGIAQSGIWYLILKGLLAFWKIVTEVVKKKAAPVAEGCHSWDCFQIVFVEVHTLEVRHLFLLLNKFHTLRLSIGLDT